MTATQTEKAPVHQELVSLLMACSANLEDKTAMLVAADWCQENDMNSLEALLRWLAVNNRLMIFTGSRCYGRPKAESDFDWVLFTERRVESYAAGKNSRRIPIYHDDLADLRYFADSDSSYGNCTYRGATGIDAALRFGPVNILCVSSMEQWYAWANGVDRLLAEAPVHRDRACEVFQEEFAENDLGPRLDY